mmetsp:Transcript_30628/g.90967  ORF Transcript_30628/g.90967 Transcript_30628/m.90967 type:complete len:227 (-) Transcript_30628:549-1229(-)
MRRDRARAAQLGGADLEPSVVHSGRRSADEEGELESRRAEDSEPVVLRVADVDQLARRPRTVQLRRRVSDGHPLRENHLAGSRPVRADGGELGAVRDSQLDEPVPQRVGDKDVLAANVGDDAHRRLELSLHMRRRGRQLRGQEGAPAPDDEPRRAARGVDEAQEVVSRVRDCELAPGEHRNRRGRLEPARGARQRVRLVWVEQRLVAEQPCRADCGSPRRADALES